MNSRTAWLLAVGVVGLSCGSPTDGCGCPPASAVATVFGRLATLTGEPIEKAMVFAYTDVAGECARKPSPDGFGETAADGNYRFQIVGPVPSDPVCVLLSFRAPIGSSLASPPDTSVMLAFRYSAPLDSARVDATFAQ